MFSNKKIVFEELNIIRADTLQQSVMYPVEMLNIFFQSYSDGIIEGADLVKATETEITIAPGIIKYNNKIYHMSEKVQIRYQKTNAMNYLKIRFLDREMTTNGEVYKSEIVISDTADCFPYEMEIARFVPDKGATLRVTAENLEDVSIAHNHADVRYAKYASVGGDTISPEITYLFAKEMVQLDAKDDVDMAFILKCLGKKPINKEVIGAYISYKRKNKKYSYSNEEIYTELLSILKETKQKRSTQRSEPQRSFRSILVD